MDLSIPFETPSTRGPGSRGLVRDALKELRQGNGEEIRALRALSDYKLTSPQGGEWRLPWTSTRKKTQLDDSDEVRIVSIATSLLLSRLIQARVVSKDYKQANAFVSQAVKSLQLQGTSSHSDLSKETVDALQAIFSGLAHELLLLKLLDSEDAISRANAAVHARVAMYSQDQFSTALQRSPKALKTWLEGHRRYTLAICHLMVGYEQAALGQQGAAIAHFKQAKIHPEISERAAVALNEAESANRLVAFQPIPASTTLPAGRCVVNFTTDYF